MFPDLICATCVYAPFLLMWRYMASTSLISWGVGFLAAAAIQRRPLCDEYQVRPSTLHTHRHTQMHTDTHRMRWYLCFIGYYNSVKAHAGFGFYSLPLDAFDQQRGPWLVHAEAPASVSHLLQLFVLEPQPVASFVSLVLGQTLSLLHVSPVVSTASNIHPLQNKVMSSIWIHLSWQ